MFNLLFAFFSFQTQPAETRDGLPYWIFWFLLCIILLLVAFIFLRDKDLRQKLNLFFFRAKNNLIKIQLQVRLKKERRKKDGLIRELGKKTWREGIRVVKSKKIERNLKNLEKNRIRFQKKLEEINSKIEMLKNELIESDQKFDDEVKEQQAKIKHQREKLAEVDENQRQKKFDILQKKQEIEDLKINLKAVDKKAKKIENNHNLLEEKKKIKSAQIEQKIKNLEKKREIILKEIRQLRKEKTEIAKEKTALQEMVELCERRIKEIEEAKNEQRHRFLREAQVWQKEKEKIHDKLREIVKQKEPLFESLGKLIDDLRVDNELLDAFYSQIDKVDKRIRELERQTQNL
jgi:chromosome segregation ATPase